MPKGHMIFPSTNETKKISRVEISVLTGGGPASRSRAVTCGFMGRVALLLAVVLSLAGCAGVNMYHKKEPVEFVTTLKGDKVSLGYVEVENHEL